MEAELRRQPVLKGGRRSLSETRNSPLHWTGKIKLGQMSIFVSRQAEDIIGGDGGKMMWEGKSEGKILS